MQNQEIQKSKEDVKKILLEHLELMVEDKGEYTAVREIRKFVSWYIKGFSNATEMRRVVNQIENLEELKQKIGIFLQD